MSMRAAPLDMAAARPHLPPALRIYLDGVDSRMAADDGMDTDDLHYLLAGSSALGVIQAALRLAGVEAPGRILDFGSGAGRVTRWLGAAYPAAALACTDLRPSDVAFCREVFRAEAWLSSTDVEALDFRGTHDVIWMGSVLTHLDEAHTRRLVARAMEALRPGGLLVATTIGRVARDRQDREGAYLAGPNWAAVKAGYDERGYGYTDYEAIEGFEAGYGLSLSSPAWAARLATGEAGRRLVLLSEAAWDGTQDVFALQADPAFQADPDLPGQHEREAAALRERVLALQNSTSWRATAPLRRLAKALGRR